MPRNSIIRVGLALLLGVGLFIGWRWKDQQDFINSSKVYEDTTNGFTFRYPVTWDFIAQDNDLAIRNEKFTVGVSVVGEPSTAVGVIVRAHSTQEVIDERQLLEDIQQQLTTQFTDYQLLKSKTKRFDTYTVLDIEYTQKHADTSYVHQRQRIFVTDKNVYIISGSSLLVNYPQRKKDLKHILDSFTLLESPR